jgi:DNA-binding NarL/FixJ family response regulator
MISPKVDAALEKTTAPMNRRPRILLADDHTMLLDAFQRLLEPRCEIVGTACDGRALINLVASTRPDVIAPAFADSEGASNFLSRSKSTQATC